MIKAGTVSSSVGYVSDLMPTITELAGAKYPTTFKGNKITPVSGQSLVPLFKGQTYKGRELVFWEHEGNKAVRQGNWKLVSRYDYKNNTELPWELYDVKTDRSEMINLADKYPQKFTELQKLYADWAKSVQVVPYKDLLALRKSKGAVKKGE